jgi:hypothetical protein
MILDFCWFCCAIDETGRIPEMRRTNKKNGLKFFMAKIFVDHKLPINWVFRIFSRW